MVPRRRPAGDSTKPRRRAVAPADPGRRFRQAGRVPRGRRGLGAADGEPGRRARCDRVSCDPSPSCAKCVPCEPSLSYHSSAPRVFARNPTRPSEHHPSVRRSVRPEGATTPSNGRLPGQTRARNSLVSPTPRRSAMHPLPAHFTCSSRPAPFQKLHEEDACITEPDRCAASTLSGSLAQRLTG